MESGQKSMKLNSINIFFSDPGYDLLRDIVESENVYSKVNNRVWGDVQDIMMFYMDVAQWVCDNET